MKALLGLALLLGLTACGKVSPPCVSIPVSGAEVWVIDGKKYDIVSTRCLLTDKGQAFLEIMAYADISYEPVKTTYTNRPLAYAFAMYACISNYPSKALHAIVTNCPPVLSGIEVCLIQRPTTNTNGRLLGQRYDIPVFLVTNMNGQESSPPLPPAPENGG